MKPSVIIKPPHMKNLFYLLFISVAFNSCQSKPSNVKKDKKPQKLLTKWDSLMYELDTATGKKKAMLNISPDHFDTVKIATSPVQIISKEFISEKDYLGLEEEFILIRYKNISQKTITGVKLRWYCEDGFGEPNLMLDLSGGLMISIGEARNGERLKPGESQSIKYKQNYETGDRLVSAWAYQVGFDDQTIWSIK